MTLRYVGRQEFIKALVKIVSYYKHEDLKENFSYVALCGITQGQLQILTEHSTLFVCLFVTEATQFCVTAGSTLIKRGLTTVKLMIKNRVETRLVYKHPKKLDSLISNTH